jgi:hypothetical protein
VRPHSRKLRRGDRISPAFMKSIYFERSTRLVFKWVFDHIAGRGKKFSTAAVMGYTMPLLTGHRDTSDLAERLRDAHAVTAELLSEIISEACWRFPPIRRTEKSARIERLIKSGAWTDAALALIELELPQWQVRRIIYDEGEWHCALSRQRELPDWLDSCIETRHVDLPLAILSAFVDAQRVSVPSVRTSVPTVPSVANPLYEAVCCDNFA